MQRVLFTIISSNNIDFIFMPYQESQLVLSHHIIVLQRTIFHTLLDRNVSGDRHRRYPLDHESQYQ